MRLEHVVGISRIENGVCDGMSSFCPVCRDVVIGNRNVWISDRIPRIRPSMMNSCDLQGSTQC